MFTLCQALLQAACPISIFIGDLERLGPYVTTLLDYSERNALGFWQVWAGCFRGVHLVKGGKIKEGLTHLSEGLDSLRGMQYGVYYAVFLCEYAEALGKAGQVDQGLVAIDEALARSKRNDEYWYVPELLRVKGELVSQSGRSDSGQRRREVVWAIPGFGAPTTSASMGTAHGHQSFSIDARSRPRQSGNRALLRVRVREIHGRI